MANEAILTPGYDVTNEVPEEITSSEKRYLQIENCLGELANDESRARARYNLRVPSENLLTEITENLDTRISEGAARAVNEHLTEEDPHGTKAWALLEFPKYIKRDGSTKFTAPLSGVEPTKDEHLTTKGFVKKLLEQYKLENNPDLLLPKVELMLEEYLKTSENTSKNLNYKLKEEITEKISKFVKIDGSTAFTKPQVGVYPTSNVHLSTKKYVDDKVSLHVTSVDPHGFITILNQRLAKYAKAENVLDKTLTYSRTLIDNEISKIVEQAINESLSEFKDSVNGRFEYIRKENYVKQDGTTSFKNPQPGVDAIEESHLVTLRLLNQQVDKVSNELSDKIKKETAYWITSGPVETTVGFLEDNSRVPEKMTIQEVLDAIFYGKRVTVTSPLTSNVGDTVDVVVCITGGDLNTVDLAELYQNGVLIRTILREEFEENGCVSVTSDKIEGDTEFEFKVYYSNDAEHSEYSETKLSYPIFAGILPDWYFGTYVTYEDLLKLSQKDPDNNEFYDRESHLRELVHQYNFDTKKPVKLLLALPTTYPDLKAMMNRGLKFTDGSFSKVTKDSFSEINVTPFTINGVLTDYKLYIYNQPLVRLDSEIIFKF